MGEHHLSEIYQEAEVYEAVYRGRGKDYGTDAARIAAVARGYAPGAATLLDVACGTGAHLRHFGELFDQVEGVDLADDMLRIAKERAPSIPVHQGDMRDFRLGRSFDVVTCLFSSIGYLRSTEELDEAVACLARHLNPGGVIVLEPWCFPENFTPGQVMRDLVTVDGDTIARVSHTVREGQDARIEVHYLVARPGTGVRHFTDIHVLRLFSREQYESAFHRAGCRAEYLPGDGVGLFVATLGPPRNGPTSLRSDRHGHTTAEDSGSLGVHP
ncbi:class I SAM-dependent DNA methyltransferase [Streptomyces sp. NPDC060006]|uniref:class I SAM-dependent DNA methyltransferase n=1 Tax=unclassified Streptomyces TaxID=2593676 RepID=UPI0036C1D2B4